MKLFVLAVLLVAMAVPAWSEVKGIQTIYRTVAEDDGNTLFMVRSTNQRNRYFWYVGTMRCNATLKGMALSIACPESPVMVAVPDSGDLAMKIDNETVGVYVDGSILFGMYRSIVTHASMTH